MKMYCDPKQKRRKDLGQCFLEDKNILALEAKLLNPKHKTVLEIGAGDGRLTAAVLQQKPKKIIAVEKDPGFAAMLRDRFAQEINAGAVEVVEADFLEMKFPKEVELVVGNIPYYISSDIIFALKGHPIELAVLMVQKEFAQKMVAPAGSEKYGRLSVTSQLCFEAKLEHTVGRHLFRPAPKVDSAIITLKPTGRQLSSFEENVIRYLFSHKNKTVRNALLDSKMFEPKELERLCGLAQQFGALAKRRAKTLTKEECLDVAKMLGQCQKYH